MSQGRKTTLTYKNINSFFSFSFIIRNKHIGRVRHSRWQLILHTQWQDTCLQLNMSSSFSIFDRLVQGHVEVRNHISFSSLLDCFEFRTEPSQNIKSSQFLQASLLLQISCITGFLHLSNLSSIVQGQSPEWCLVAAFSRTKMFKK